MNDEVSSARRVTEVGEEERGVRTSYGEDERVPRTRMESIHGGKCVPLALHACFRAWGGQTCEYLRGAVGGSGG